MGKKVKAPKTKEDKIFSALCNSDIEKMMHYAEELTLEELEAPYKGIHRINNVDCDVTYTFLGTVIDNSHSPKMTQIIDKLVDRGVDINALPNKQSCTNIVKTIFTNNLDATGILITKGAALVDLEGNDPVIGKSAIDYIQTAPKFDFINKRDSNDFVLERLRNETDTSSLRKNINNVAKRLISTEDEIKLTKMYNLVVDAARNGQTTNGEPILLKRADDSFIPETLKRTAIKVIAASPA